MMISVLFVLTCLSGRTSFPMLIRTRPIRPLILGEKNSIIFELPVDTVREAAIYAVKCHKITKQKPYYIEVYVPAEWQNLQVGIMGGETVGIWLEPLG